MARSLSWFLLTVCVVGVLLAREGRNPSSPLAGIDRAFLDWLNANAQPSPPAPGAPPVTLVAIDDDVADNPRRLPLSVLEYASFLHSVAKYEPAAVAIVPVIDVAHAPPGTEQLLLDEAIQVPRLLLGVRLGSRAGGGREPVNLPGIEHPGGNPARLPDFPEIVEAPGASLLTLAAATGATNLPGAENAPVRDVPLLFRCRERVVPAFALETLVLALRLAPSEVSVTLGSRVQLGDRLRLPIDAAGRAVLDSRAFGRVGRISLDDLPLLVVGQATPAAQAAAAGLRGGVVVLGRTDRSARTLRTPDGRQISPAEAFAWAAASMEGTPATRRAGPWWDGGIVVGFAAVGGWALGRRSRRSGTAVAAVALVAYAMGALSLFESMRLWLPCALPIGLTLLILGLLWLPSGAREVRLVLMLLVASNGFSASARAATFHVSPSGNDANPGTAAQPFATVARAQTAARGFAGREPVEVQLHEGTFYLAEPLVFTAADSGTRQAPVVYQAAPGERAVVSGGVRLALEWRPYRDGIVQARVPEDLQTEELFVNGARQTLARYPNFDPAARYFDGYAQDAISPERAARWADPAGGYLHAMHPALWGDFTWRITGKDAGGKITLEGGWQNNRGGAMHKDIRFVENIFEELDTPGEWFLDRKAHVLHFFPPAGLDLARATVEATRLRTLVEFRGDAEHPVRFVSLRGLTFRHAARTMMETKEPLLRTDWAIHRGGAVFFNGAEDCSLEDGLLDQAGGNAVFVNGYNRRVTVRGCEIDRAGASGVCFVGDPKAVRSPLFSYNQPNTLESIDLTPGPLTEDFPAQCLVEDCLIHLTGRVEKQTAGVEIDIAQDITVRHCSIYDMPRAGINIGDGCFGGHVVEGCDVFDTVKETGDHGSFNSWGRDRFWMPDPAEINRRVAQNPALPLLDVVKPITLRNNRWRCDHGWDIDLDDGSSNYLITENLCLNGGIKNREGYARTVTNNILANNGFHPHVWLSGSGDSVTRNIFYGAYRPARMPPKPWGKEMDYNLLHKRSADPVQPAAALQAQSGRDEHSVIADARFADPAHGDFRVGDGSPALALGFRNFPMDGFGVQKASLRAIARTPSLLAATEAKPNRDTGTKVWGGATLRNIAGQGEVSSYGTPGETGILVLGVEPGSPCETAGLKPGDVILALDGGSADTLVDFLRRVGTGRDCRLTILRNQRENTLTARFP